VAIASVEGLERLTIGRLAVELGMSKSGVLGHFGSKEVLQLEVVDEAAAVFTREVADRAAGAEHGFPRLLALSGAWVSYLERGVFPGGCFFTAAGVEFDDRPGRVRDAVAALTGVWEGDLRRQARLAVEAGDLPADTDPDQVVFELLGATFALNHALRLHGDSSALPRARRVMARVLGHELPR